MITTKEQAPQFFFVLQIWSIGIYTANPYTAFSDKYIMSSSSGQGFYITNSYGMIDLFGPKPYQRPYFFTGYQRWGVEIWQSTVPKFSTLKYYM